MICAALCRRYETRSAGAVAFANALKTSRITTFSIGSAFSANGLWRATAA